MLARRVWVSTWALEKRVSSNTDSRSLQRKSRLLIRATFDPWNEALLHQTPTPECSFKDYFRLTWYICPNPQKDKRVIQGDGAADDVSRLQMPWFVARLNWQTGDLRRLVAAVHSNRKRKNQKKTARLSQIPAASALAKGHNISLLVFRAGENKKNNSWSESSDRFLWGMSGVFTELRSIKQNFPPKVSCSGESKREAAWLKELFVFPLQKARQELLPVKDVFIDLGPLFSPPILANEIKRDPNV